MNDKINVLEWDSSFFNLSVGKAEITKKNPCPIERIKLEKNNRYFDLVYVFSDQELDISNQPDVFLADEKVTFKKKIYPSETNILTDTIIYHGPPTLVLENLATASGHCSRFKKDHRTSARCNDLYITWLDKSLSGELADIVFTTYCNKTISGFLTLRKVLNSGRIGLFSVSKNMQRIGLGYKLIKSAEQWCLHNSLNNCEVATQKDNETACNFYKKSGYTIKDITYIYHL